jgi:O-acetyl-ADP-ribose deacetylase (regulator of RNase III)
MRFEAQLGDITRQPDVDVIVNAANEALARGAGVCGAIFAAAGPELDAACAAIGGCPTGDAVATPGFGTGVRWIVHAVGPVWRGGDHHEAGLLASAYRRSIDVARDLGARSIAFPAISTGIYGYPCDEAAGVAVATLRQCAADLDFVRLVAFDADTLAAYERNLARP